MVKEKGKDNEFESMVARLHEKYDIQRKWTEEFVSTGILSLDMATTKGGIPRGLLVDLYGDEGLGKTTMSLTMIAERIKQGERCAFIDIEHRLNPQLKRMIIPDDKGLLEIFEPKDGDNAFSIVEQILQYPEFRMVVLDSLAALVFPEVKEEDKHTEPIALGARRIGLHTKKIMEMIYQHSSIVVFINQMRMGISMYGPLTKTSTGGKAIRFFSSLRLNMKSGEPLKSVDQIYGQKVKLVIDKNSFGPPFRQTFIYLIYGKGIDRTTDLINCATELGLVKQKASWLFFSLKNSKGEVKEIQGQGVRGLVEELTPMWDQVVAQVREAMKKQLAEELPN